jgi:leader peptidase (prepilin peptidase)/N-methyltransferase
VILSNSESLPPGFIGIFVFLFGLIFGSFGNVLIARLPNSENIAKPRSRCPHCKKLIAWYDNIPVLSFLILKAKCRQCKNPISIRYPIIELLSAILFLGIYLRMGLTWTWLEMAIFAWAGLVASVIDIDHRILPDVITLPGIVIGLLGAMLNPDRLFIDALAGVLGGGGFLWLVAYVYSAIRKEEGMGGGDIKLIAWIGAVLGWRAVIFSILVSSISGSIFGLSIAAFKKSGLKTAIPFGPFLYGAAILYIFIGVGAMRAYLSIFFPFAE